MKITYIKIKNFRSIKDEVFFDIESIGKKDCFILLGINESGKSNILNAISLLDDNAECNYNANINNIADDDSENIQLDFGLNFENYSFYKEKFIEEGIPEDLVNKIKIDKIEKQILINSENNRQNNIWIRINDNKKEFSKYVINNKNITVNGSVQKNEIIELKTDENIILKDGIEENILDKKKLEKILEKSFYKIINNHIPKVIFWKSEDKYLINKEIDLNIFKDKTSESLPLRNCFKIAGFDDIKKKIESVTGNPGKIESLKDKLSNDVTEHVNNIWKEHKINIKFVINSMKLSFYVEDKQNTIPKYEVSQRSDGFKHFISILLNLSVENKTNQLKNKIIILDEPEVHLHPSGVKYLRDELLKISENNLVIFATHSIYMVDKLYLNRHFSIKKEGGSTELIQIEKDNPYKEEVLYEALGTTVLEHVENNILIFEGKTDRDIFELYKKRFGVILKTPNLSLISGDGCENIIKYTKFFNTKIIKGYVLFDSDKDGMKEKTKVLKEKGYTNKNTFDINGILNTKKESTLEDLFNKQYLIDSVFEFYDGLVINLDDKNPFLEQMKEQLKDNKKPYRKEDNKKLKGIFCKKILVLTKENLKKELYYSFFENFSKKFT